MSEQEREPVRYELRTVKDFFLVPEERRGDCLHDFGLWVSVMISLDELFGDIKGFRSKTDVFAWLDDGRHDAVLSVNVLHGPDSSTR